jgi:hypothetical protein
MAVRLRMPATSETNSLGACSGNCRHPGAFGPIPIVSGLCRHKKGNATRCLSEECLSSVTHFHFGLSNLHWLLFVLFLCCLSLLLWAHAA